MDSRDRPYRTTSNLEARIALHARFSTNPKGWMPWLFEQLEAPAGARILEVGCGPGTFWQENASRVGRRWRLTLSDASIAMVRRARDGTSALGPQARFEVADVSSIPHRDGRFDRVVANHMLYHAPRPDRALAEIRRVVRPGGRLLASTLGADSLLEIRDLVRTATTRSDFWAHRPSDPFCLENAGVQLSAVFPAVTLRTYQDSLLVTEVEPVLGYLRSLILEEPFREDELRAVGEAVSDRVRAEGGLRVRKSAGVFVCERGA